VKRTKRISGTGQLQRQRECAKCGTRFDTLEKLIAITKARAKVNVKAKTKFENNQRIIVQPAGRENPRRKGSAPYKRYEALLKANTVVSSSRRSPSGAPPLPAQCVRS